MAQCVHVNLKKYILFITTLYEYSTLDFGSAQTSARKNSNSWMLVGIALNSVEFGNRSFLLELFEHTVKYWPSIAKTFHCKFVINLVGVFVR